MLVARLNGTLPATREKWEEAHPGKDWDTDRDRLLPGKIGDQSEECNPCLAR
jgi:hypothetical protein